LIQNGIEGVVVAGCTGSASLLNHQEQVEAIGYVNEKFGNRIHVIAGDGSNCTREAISLARAVERDAGVFTHLSISPYYNKPSDQGMLGHFNAIADSIEGNIVLYSVPSRTGGLGITSEIAAALSNHPRIIGIKESSGDIERIARTVSYTSTNNFSVMVGDDKLAIQGILYGARGLVSVVGNCFPAEVSRIVHLSRRCRPEYAHFLEAHLDEFREAIFQGSKTGNVSPNPDTIRHALERMGFRMGTPRLPSTLLTEDSADLIDRAYEQACHSISESERSRRL